MVTSTISASDSISWSKLRQVERSASTLALVPSCGTSSTTWSLSEVHSAVISRSFSPGKQAITFQKWTCYSSKLSTKSNVNGNNKRLRVPEFSSTAKQVQQEQIVAQINSSFKATTIGQGKLSPMKSGSLQTQPAGQQALLAEIYASELSCPPKTQSSSMGPLGWCQSNIERSHVLFIVLWCFMLGKK